MVNDKVPHAPILVCSDERCPRLDGVVICAVRIRDDALSQSNFRDGRGIKCIDAGLRNPAENIPVWICLYRIQHFAGESHTKALGCCLNTVRKKAEHRQIIGLLAQ